MALKILQGLAKGLSLEAPSAGTRPTSVLLRRKVFDAYQDMSGSVFIDCCAGSGAMGLEASSRGAADLVLIESARQAFQRLKKNVQQFERRVPCAKVQLSSQACQKWLNTNLEKEEWPCVIVFLDPPYADKQTYFEVIELLKRKKNWSGELWLESDFQKGVALDELEKDDVLGKARRVYKKGTSYMAIWPFG